MTIRSIALAGVLALAATAPAANAAMLNFDLSGLGNLFTGANVAGGFSFDTATRTFSDTAIATPIGAYGDDSGTLIPDTAGFGFPQDIFSFDNGATTFFFSLAALDLADPAVGTTTFSDTFAFESDMVNADFQIDPFGNSASYLGDVAVTSVELAPVPLPAALPLMLVGLAGFGALRRRHT